LLAPARLQRKGRIKPVVFAELKAEDIKQLEQEIEKTGTRVIIIPILCLP
jgi:hypothetical protein